MPPAPKKATAAKAAPAEPKPEDVAPQGEQPAPDTGASNVDVTSVQSQEPAQEPVPDSEQPAGTQDDESEAEPLTEDEDEDEDEDEEPVPEEMVNVLEPCPTCYPEGWYEGATDGTVASCPHLAVAYGVPVALSAQQAFDLGYRPLEG